MSLPNVLALYPAFNAVALGFLLGFGWTFGCWLAARCLTPFGRRDPV
jgi:hypothetical protein